MLQTELGSIDAVTSALERKRPGVASHCLRVSAYAVRLATQYGLGSDDIETIRLGGLLHDVGKMLVPSRILDKPGRPNAREWQELKIHPELGVEIAHRSGFDDEVCGIVLYHHERYDGSGYPDGLSGRAIHYLVRIVSVMDTFDALTSPRDYRERLTPEAARAVIARGAGTKFCPWVVSGFLALPLDLLMPASDEASVVAGQPEGAVSLSPDQFAQPWLLRAESYQFSAC
ncbi:MAG: HD-GYP domain-containing protein [Acidobacteria bacterium]|nr:HD-GYP domain-containing protein [Acidobacteriota bacterium]